MSADPDVLQKLLKTLCDSPGSTRTWDKLYWLMLRKIFAEAYYLLDGDVVKAEDAAHAVLMSLARTHRLEMLEEPLAFLSYVSSTVIKECRVVRRRHSDPEMKEGEREEVREMLRELDETSDKASQKLWAEERAVLEQYFVERLTCKKLAERRNMTEDAARELVVRARLHLRLVTGHDLENLPSDFE